VNSAASVAPQDLQASVREAPPLVVVDLVGSVTALGESTFLNAVGSAIDKTAGDVLLNFTGVDYINSAGIGIILDGLAQVREAGRRLLVTGLTPHYRKVFSMMGLSQHAQVFETEAAARQAAAQN